METVEEGAVEDLEIDAVEAGTIVGGPVAGIIALAAIEAVKEVGEVLVESVVESAGGAVREALQDAVGAAVKSAASATADEAMRDATEVMAGEAMIDSVVEKVYAKVEDGLSNKLKKRVRGH